MTQAIMIVAEMRAGELLAALQSALNGDAHWRIRAAVLLREISDLVLPPATTEALLLATVQELIARFPNE